LIEPVATTSETPIYNQKNGYLITKHPEKELREEK